MKYTLTAALVGALISSATAHTWIEELLVIASNGTMIGTPGYPRGYVPRGSSGSVDAQMVNLIPPNGRQINTILNTDLMCRPSQTTMTQTNGSPRLQAPAGANVALRYQENGHVTLPQNQPGKPPNRGTVYVYGTTQAKPDDKFLDIHRIWNAAGTGGDGRGVLISTQNFDDGQCYQINSGTISQQRQKQFAHANDPLMGSDLWCQVDIQIPATAPSGQPYTLYWVWDWPTMPGTQGFPQGKQELYTTCMDVDITQSAPNQVVANNFIVAQNLNHAAISSEFANIANPTFITGSMIPFSGQASATAATVSTPGSSASSSAAAIPASLTTSTPSTVSSVGFTAPATITVTNMQTITSAVATSTAIQTGPVSSAPASVPGPRPSVHAIPSEWGPVNWQPQNDWQHGPPDGFVPGNFQAAVVTRTARMQTVTVTDVASVFETIYQTVTANAVKRAEATGLATQCSKSAPAYRLRARSPLYLLRPQEDANTGC